MIRAIHTLHLITFLCFILLAVLTGCQKDGPEPSTVRLLFTVPSASLPDYAPTRTSAAVALRGVMQVYAKGTSKQVTTERAMLTPTGKKDEYSLTLSLDKGEYDANLWVDYATDKDEDNHYMTDDLNSVKILPPDEYAGNTDDADAFSARFALSVAEQTATVPVILFHPLAKYRLVATDVDKYDEMRERRGYPPVEDVKIEVMY